MSAALIRLALFQFMAVILTILLAGFTLKARFGSGSQLPILATYVRDYGIFLLLVPAAWAIWGAIELNRPLAGTGDGGSVFLSGVVLLGLLACFGFASLISASSFRSLVIAAPQQRSAPANPTARAE